MAGSIVVFSGMDGAGKSTQIELLRKELAAENRQPVVLWSRGGYTPGISLLKSLLRRASSGKALPAQGPSEARTQAFRRPIVRTLWLTLAILDLALLYGVWVRLQKLLGRVVICDRYLDDTSLDFQINFANDSVKCWWLWRLLEWVTPVPDAAFLLLVSVEESQRRSVLKNEPFPDSAEVLATRLATYQSWPASEWTTIDGTHTQEEIARVILSQVNHGDCKADQTLAASPATSIHRTNSA